MALSNDDKTAIRELIRIGISEAQAERRLLGAHVLIGETGGAATEFVPTKSKTKEIADQSSKDAIDNYKKNLPKWYDVRRRIDSASALVVVFFALVLLLYQVAKPSGWYGVVEAFHWIFDTEEKVKIVLDSEKAGWEDDTDFKRITGGAFRKWITNEPRIDNPIRDFVKNTLEASPVLVFQGEATFNNVSETNKDCVDFNFQLVSVLPQPEVLMSVPGQSYPDPALIPRVCGNFLSNAIDAPLDVPFFARIYETEADGPADEVFAILVVKREAKDAPGPVTARVGDNGGPAGLCITYTTQNSRFRVDGSPSESLGLAKAISEAGKGTDFWEVNISDAIAPYIGTAPAGFHVGQILHSINVRPITDPNDLVGNNDCVDVKPVDDQILSVRVLVFVNKDIDNR